MMIIRFQKKKSKREERQGGQMFMKWKYSSSMDVFLKYHIKHNGYQITWEVNNLVFYKNVKMQISTILMNFRINLINFRDEINIFQKVMVLFITSKMMCNPNGVIWQILNGCYFSSYSNLGYTLNMGGYNIVKCAWQIDFNREHHQKNSSLSFYLHGSKKL